MKKFFQQILYQIHFWFHRHDWELLREKIPTNKKRRIMNEGKDYSVTYDVYRHKTNGWLLKIEWIG